MEMLSPHFSLDECKCRCKRHKDAPYCNVSPRLLSLAEKVHDLLKCPMIVTSCCRCREHNAESGGSPNSKHLCSDTQPARAMDFRPKDTAPAVAYNAIVKAWRDGRLNELGGIGLYDWGVHIDTFKAPDGHLRTWDRREAR